MHSVQRFAISLFVGTVLVIGSATAQNYPSKPIRFVVPQNPGTPPDILARILAPEMSRFIGESIIIENKPGANSIIAYEYVAKQVPADGYTMVFVTVPGLAILPLTVKGLRFDPLKDLPPFIGLGEGRYFFGTSSKYPWKTLAELVAHARANPGKLNYATTGSNVYLMSEALIRDLGLNMTRIDYGVAGPYFQALASGEVQMGFASGAAVASLGEKFRLLAGTGDRRLAPQLDVPTFSELGLPKIPGVSYTLNAPVGIPKIALDALYSAASRTLQHSEVKARFAKLQTEIAEHAPAAAAINLAEVAKFYADMAKKVGLQPE